MNETGAEEKPETFLRNIRLLIAYDGSNFSGWQRQSFGPEDRTIQGAIETALEKIHKGTVNLTGSGRTDAGVHAAGQIANFYTGIRNISPERFVPALNGILPQDIRIMKAEEAGIHFHARFDAKSRTYRYHFICRRHGLPQELRYALQLWRYPRLDVLNSYARLLRGELDCSAFAGKGDQSESKNRYIFNACFFIQGDTLVFEISANAFLRHMVRSITGTLLRCEEKDLSPEALRAIIASGDRSLAGPTAPPWGLSLCKVAY